MSVHCEDGFGEISLTSDVDDNDVIVAVHAAFDRACFIAEREAGARSLICFGNNLNGELGIGSSGDSDVPPTTVDLGTDIAVDTVALGEKHTCVLFVSGAVKCWGDGSDGRLGYDSDESLTSAAEAEMLPLPAEAVSLSTGTSHSCAILTGGNLTCWGENSFGQLGHSAAESVGSRDGVPLGAVPPVALPLPVMHVYCGASFTCSILVDRSVYCFGRNDHGQLGVGLAWAEETTTTKNMLDTVLRSAEGETLVGGPVIRLATKDNRVCALLVGGDIRCWGEGFSVRPIFPRDGGFHMGVDFDTMARDGREAAVADGHNFSIAIPGTTVGTCASSPNAAREVFVGNGIACFSLVKGELRCAGRNWDGRAGHVGIDQPGEILAVRSLPEIALGGSLLDFDTFEKMICAVLNIGSVKCWGASEAKSMGVVLPDPESADGPTYGRDADLAELPDVDIGGAVIAIGTGDDHACAVLAITGAVRCWGQDKNGLLGHGSSLEKDCIGAHVDCVSIRDAGDVDIGGKATAIAASASHTCVALGRTVQCWGNNDANGILGIRGDYAGKPPADVPSVDVGGHIVKMTAGRGFSCVLLDTQEVRCWGENARLGHGSDALDWDDASDIPVIDASEPITDLCSGMEHSCILTESGNVYCWGENGENQLGTGDGRSVDNPFEDGQVYLREKVGSISCAYMSSCAILAHGGGMMCWGKFNEGQLGYGPVPNPSEFSLDTPMRMGQTNVPPHLCCVSSIGVLEDCSGHDPFDGVLDLSGSGLRELPRDVLLANPSHMTSLDLRENNLEALPVDLMQGVCTRSRDFRVVLAANRGSGNQGECPQGTAKRYFAPDSDGPFCTRGPKVLHRESSMENWNGLSTDVTVQLRIVLEGSDLWQDDHTLRVLFERGEPVDSPECTDVRWLSAAEAATRLKHLYRPYEPQVHQVLECDVPPAAGTDVDIGVYFMGGVKSLMHERAKPLSFLSPVVSSIEPSILPRSGEGAVRIHGGHFGAPNVDMPIVRFGSCICEQVTRVSSDEILCDAVPPGYQPRDVLVSLAGQDSNHIGSQPVALSYEPPAVHCVFVESYDMSCANALLDAPVASGDDLFLVGANFALPSPAQCSVGSSSSSLVAAVQLVGEQDTPFRCVDVQEAGQSYGSLLRCQVQPGVGGNLSVSLSIGDSPAIALEPAAHQRLRYGAPEIRAVTVPEGGVLDPSGNSRIVLNGANFGPPDVDLSFWIDGTVPCIPNDDSDRTDTERSCVAPAGVGGGLTLSVEAGSLSAVAPSLVSYAAPSIDSLEPCVFFLPPEESLEFNRSSTAFYFNVSQCGPPDARAAWSSRENAPAVGAYVAGSACEEVATSSVSDTACTVVCRHVSPKEFSGAASPVVTVGGQSPSSGGANLFEVVGTPETSAVVPVTGPVAGGISIDVIGQNFGPGGGCPIPSGSVRSIAVGPFPCTSIQPTSHLSVRCTLSAGAGANLPIVVETAGGRRSAVSSNARFSYDPPVLTSVSPARLERSNVPATLDFVIDVDNLGTRDALETLAAFDSDAQGSEEFLVGQLKDGDFTVPCGEVLISRTEDEADGSDSDTARVECRGLNSSLLQPRTFTMHLRVGGRDAQAPPGQSLPTVAIVGDRARAPWGLRGVREPGRAEVGYLRWLVEERKTAADAFDEGSLADPIVVDEQLSVFDVQLTRITRGPEDVKHARWHESLNELFDPDASSGGATIVAQQIRRARATMRRAGLAAAGELVIWEATAEVSLTDGRPFVARIQASNRNGESPWSPASAPILSECAEDEFLASHRQFTDVECQDCPSGAYCGGGWFPDIVPRQGFWRTPWSESGLDFVRCSRAQSCFGWSESSNLTIPEIQSRLGYGHRHTMNGRSVNESGGASSRSLTAASVSLSATAGDSGRDSGEEAILARLDSLFSRTLAQSQLNFSESFGPRVHAEVTQSIERASRGEDRRASSSCDEGHTGPACVACASDYARTFDGSCTPCGDAVGSTVVGGIILVVVVVVVALLLRRVLRSGGGNSVGMSLLKVLVNHLNQVSLASGIRLNWPSAVDNMFGVFTSFSTVGSETISPACAIENPPGGSRAYAKAVIFLSVPFGVLALFTMVWLIIYLRERRGRRRRRTPMSVVQRDSPPNGAAGMQSNPVHAPGVGSANLKSPGRGDQRYPERPPGSHMRVRDRWLTSVLVVAFLLHTGLTRTTMSLWACAPLSELSEGSEVQAAGGDNGAPQFLVEDPAVECGTPSHNRWILSLAVPALLLYVIGIPLGTFLLLWCNRSQLQTSQRKQRIFGFLMAGFLPARYFWECVVMCRKALVAIIAVLLRPVGESIQAISAAAVLFGFFAVQLDQRPFQSRWLNRAEESSLAVSLLTLLCGQLLMDERVTGGSRTAVTVFIVLMNAVLITGIVTAALVDWSVEEQFGVRQSRCARWCGMAIAPEELQGTKPVVVEPDDDRAARTWVARSTRSISLQRNPLRVIGEHNSHRDFNFPLPIGSGASRDGDRRREGGGRP